ncbi:AsmA protein [Photobacterium swingsii]|uniref:AsmA family protein n=1 Tax=Photobacterium swingsii TaxID=680026 RepID=A0A0J8XSP2_9GAMM|nr:AsmA family protein [Photobacterium swingsii]KMV28384.1 AsmA protein [Photobacterium swingsii]PSW22915.1 AsmA family protein [Photobacterium swingsii]
MTSANHSPDKNSTPTSSKPEKKSWFRRLCTWLVGTFSIIFLALIIALTVGIKIDLTPYRDRIAQMITDNLHRDAHISGDIELLIGFSPEIKINQIEIANIESMPWQPMLTSGHISAKINVLPLLQNTLSIDYLALNDISVLLFKDYEGKANWQFDTTPPSDNAQVSTNKDPLSFHLKIGDRITAENINLVYDDQLQGSYFDWQLNKLDLQQRDEQWHLTTQGYALGQEYNLSLDGDLEDIINQQTGNVSIQGAFAGAKLAIDASLQPPQSGESTASVKLDWQNTQPIEDLLGLDVKHVAPLSVSTNISASVNHLFVNDVKLRSPITSADGHFAIELGKHNFIDGQLDIPVIDLRPWLQPEPEPQMMMAYSSAPPQKSPLQQALDKWLIETTTKLGIQIGEIKGLGTSIENLSLNVEGEAGKLSAPMTADIAQVPFRGNATIDATEWTSNVDIQLGATNSPLGEMARWLTGIYAAKGHLEDAKLQVKTSGTKLSEWLDNSEIALSIDQANVNWAKAATFSIDKARLNAGMHLPFKSSIKGELMGIPAHISAQAGTLADIIERRDWPTQLDFESPVLTAHAEGMLVQTNWQEGSHFSLSIQGNDASALSPWLGTQTQVSGPIAIEGKLDYQDGLITLLMNDLTLMNSHGQIAVKWRPEPDNQWAAISGQFSRLDFTQFGQFINDDELPEVEQTIPTQGANLTIPLLSDDIVIIDADVDIAIDTLVWADQQLSDIAFNGKMRNGNMPSSPFKMRYAGSSYNGDISLDINAATINSQLNLIVNKPDIGQIARNLSITNDLGMTLDQAKLAIRLSGRTVLELMEMAKINAQLTGGQLLLSDIYTGKALDVYLAKGQFATGPTTDTTLSLQGEVAKRPVKLLLSSVSLKQANDGRKTLPASMALSIGDMHFNANSELALPLDFKKLALNLHAEIPNLERLNHFTGVALPPYGPITLKAQLASDESGYRFRDLLIKVNKSQLTGHGDLQPQGKYNKPDVRVALTAPFIQLDDFQVGHWQAWLDENHAPEETSTQAPQQAKSQPSPVISPEGLNWLNGDLRVAVNEVRSGKDWLGAGSLHLNLKNGHLVLEPLHVKLPGGDVAINAKIKARGDMFDIDLQGKVDNFDYGVLARRIQNDTDMSGKISTKFSLTSLANSPDTLMRNANGFIGFAAWPEAFEADLIDLWAVNLTDAILPSFTDENNSVLNCVAAGVDIRDGNIKQRNMLLDTTRIQVNGKFDASYQDRSFDLYLRPQSKKAQIFSLQTPIEVHGQFDDFNLNVPLSAIFETSVRFTTSPVISPIRWLIEKPLERDGSKTCELIWQGQQ